MTGPVPAIPSPDVRTARQQARLYARWLARRAAWRASNGDRAEFRRLMATWHAPHK